MRLMFSSFNFLLTLVVAAIAFVATTLEFPGIMRQLIEGVQQFPPLLSGWGLPDKYLVWVDILLSGEKLVLLVFVLMTRILFALVGAVFGSGHAAGGSAFDRWGR